MGPGSAILHLPRQARNLAFTLESDLPLSHPTYCLLPSAIKSSPNSLLKATFPSPLAVSALAQPLSISCARITTHTLDCSPRHCLQHRPLPFITSRGCFGRAVLKSGKMTIKTLHNLIPIFPVFFFPCHALSPLLSRHSNYLFSTSHNVPSTFITLSVGLFFCYSTSPFPQV